jgi:hypothetical protein
MTEPLPTVPVETIIEKIDKPKSSGVAIKIMVGLLILVILSEIGYLVYNNYYQPQSESISGPTIQQEDSKNITPPSPTPTTQIDNKEIVNNTDQNVFEHISKFISRPNVQFKNALISVSFEATVTEIHDQSDDYPFKLGLLQDGSPIFVTFTQRDLITAEVKNPFKPDEKLSLSDLQIGNKIIYSGTTNLINNPNGNTKTIITLQE